MEVLKFDLSKADGIFKPMNAVNNGAVHKRHNDSQKRSNLETFQAAKIPYVRNHDASFWGSYGSEHTVDISAVFPDFDADPYLPESYDFACTDEYLQVIELGGSEVFYRLGQKIEHYVKKYGIFPPKDFKKWAVICEHIIRHYNEGWANGFEMNIRYWEIWNEPDDTDDVSKQATWCGTREEFFDLFEIAAKHLKECFPKLKIGGPAVSWNEEWANDFLMEMSARNVPLDFFSWHKYCFEPKTISETAHRYKKMLNENGYTDAESILNEWNYVKDWHEKFVYSIETIIGIKGAAFTMACMSEAQKAPIDMLMYYDARPCAFNGLFDFYTLRPLKGYYPFAWFSKFYRLKEVRCSDEPEKIYTLCGIDDDRKSLLAVTYYTDNDADEKKDIKIDLSRKGVYEIYLLDKENDACRIAVTDDLTFTMDANTCLLIKEI